MSVGALGLNGELRLLLVETCFMVHLGETSPRYRGEKRSSFSDTGGKTSYDYISRGPLLNLVRLLYLASGRISRHSLGGSRKSRHHAFIFRWREDVALGIRAQQSIQAGKGP